MCQHATAFLIEALEDRRLLSVSSSVLAGPLLKGTTWTYKITAPGSTYTATNKVVGTAKVSKVACWEIDTNAGATLAKAYVNLSSAGLLNYKITGSSSGPTFSSTQTHIPSPFNTIYPPSLKAKKTYTFKWTDAITTKSTPGGTSTTTDSVTYSVTLASETTTKVKVPAGTFSCYKITTKQVTTVHGFPTTVNIVHYVAPNIGEVKFVSDGVTTTTLTKFVKGK